MKKGLRMLFLFLTLASGGIGIIIAIRQGFEYTIQIKGLYPEVVFPIADAIVSLGIWLAIAAVMYGIAQLLYTEATEQ
ncbi:MAG: hypothetical protein ACRCWD_00710 [Culicoidibacterales bacterium]